MFLEDKTINPGVKADPFSLDALIAWLETQDPAERYSNADVCRGEKGCVFARYAVYLGYPGNITGYMQLLKDWGSHPSDPYTDISCRGPFTLGDALERARAIRDGAPIP